MTEATGTSSTLDKLRAHSTAIALWSAVVVGAALRIYGLTSESLWNDELYTVTHLEGGPLSEQFWKWIHADVHPPGYLILMSGWCALFGDSELALRLPSAIAGVAAIFAIFALGRRLFDEGTGALAAMLAAVSPLLITYSQEARAYQLLVLFTVLLADRLTALAHGTPPTRPVLSSALAGIVAAATAYLHYSGFLATGTLFCFFLGIGFAFRRQSLPCLIGAALVAAALYSPWVPGLIHHMKAGGLGWLDAPTLLDLLRFARAVLPGVALGAALVFLIPWGQRCPSWLGTPPRDNRFAVTLLLWWVLSLIVGFWIKSVLGKPILNIRNLIVAAPPILLILAHVACRRVRFRYAVAWAVVVVVAVMGLFVFDQNYYSKQTKEDFRGRAAIAATWATDHVDAPILMNTRSFNYYLRPLVPGRKTLPIRNHRRLISRTIKLGKRHRWTILLAGHRTLTNSEIDRLRSEFARVDIRELRRVQVLLLENL